MMSELGPNSDLGLRNRNVSSCSNEFETLCMFDAASQVRQVAYNVVALETGQPKSPSGANEKHRMPSAGMPS